MTDVDPVLPLSDETPTSVLEAAKRLASDAESILDNFAAAKNDVLSAFEAERTRIGQSQLRNMPLKALKTASKGQLRLGAMEAAGFRTVADVRKATKARLMRIQGVGEQTAGQVIAAAQNLESALHTAARVRFDVDARPHGQADILLALRRLNVHTDRVAPMRGDLQQVQRTINGAIPTAHLLTRRIRRVFTMPKNRDRAREALVRLERLLASDEARALRAQIAAARNELESAAGNIWNDYIERSVMYNGLLLEIAGLDVDTEASQGFLPQDIVERIRAFDLNDELLKASLRGYQSFGARFALVQARTILGDEMGLGKTIEALAVLCHLRSHGATHFAVVCPASVLVNWEREIVRHSRLESPMRLHGDWREPLFDQWMRSGGVALTTFDTLRALNVPHRRLAALVVDEAHYVKNPEALRTRAVKSWLAQSDLALLMSGTPMENRVEEFRSLVKHIRPEVASIIRSTDGLAGADAFRHTVAPVYLRRNQTDVLNELPPRIEAEDWLSLDGSPAAAAYRHAVMGRNFMAMRRAAFATDRPEESPKMVRLLEIVNEAEVNGLKVVVFSYFRDVVSAVHRALGRRAVGPLTGDVSPTDRLNLVDTFSQSHEPGVLVSQIEAGGVGLNIQAASVVILTEPQWKPTTEEQAIARCHRMGQVRPVQVHRLLAENSVDERMLEVLQRKADLFAAFVHRSALKDAAPEAVDVSDVTATREVASIAEQERRIIELERRRLGMET